MTENPYRSPIEDAPPVDRSMIELRSYHVPFIIAAVCCLVLMITSNMTFVNANHFVACMSAVATILVFDIPVCGLVIWEWWRTGEPPKLSFEPLFDSAESRALRRTLKQRPQLDDKAFYRTFYADTGIATQIVTEVRRELQAMLGRSLAGVHPTDDLGLIEPEMDLADVFDELAEAFEIVIPWRSGQVSIDGSFDSLVRLVARYVETNAPIE